MPYRMYIVNMQCVILIFGSSWGANGIKQYAKRAVKQTKYPHICIQANHHTYHRIIRHKHLHEFGEALQK